MTTANGGPVYEPGSVTFETLADTPEDYRKMLHTLVGKQFVGEIAACEMFSRAVYFIDEPAHKVDVVFTVKEEAEHVAAMEKLSRDIGLDVDSWLARRRRAGLHFLGTEEDVKDWIEVCVFKHLIDRAGRVWLWSMRNTSFGPYGETMAPIIKDEARHGEDGAQAVIALCEAGHRDAVQAKVDYWFPRGIQLLGRPGSEGNRLAHHYGLKLHDSDEEMRKWLGEILPSLEKAGLSVPSPDSVRAMGVDIVDIDW